MDRARRLLLILILALGSTRMVYYFAYAIAILPYPLETYSLEAISVLMAHRVMAGESLYPAWQDYPHVANFVGPVYFSMVGLLGFAFDADIPDLFLLGRCLTFASAVLTTSLLYWTISKRYGFKAGVAGAVLSLGAAPMYGFSVMVRADLTAEWLGFGGFLLGGHSSRTGRLTCVTLLALAILTKQTAAVFLLAFVLATAAEGRWRMALVGLGGCAAILFVSVGLMAVLHEPHIISSLLGQGRIPWDIADWSSLVRRVCLLSPDLILFPVMGLFLWTRDWTGTKDIRAASLTIVILVSSLVLSGKRGADANYYLSLRLCEALAVGTLWHLRRPVDGRGRSAGLTLMAAAATLALLPSTFYSASQAFSARKRAADLKEPAGNTLLNSYRKIFIMSRDPRFRILTDSGLVDLYRQERAEFGDPYLFRLLVETGRIHPDVMRKRIETQYYDVIITGSDINSRGYDDYASGLPISLLERARERYIPIGSEAGFFFYGRRREGGDFARPERPPR